MNSVKEMFETKRYLEVELEKIPEGVQDNKLFFRRKAIRYMLEGIQDIVEYTGIKEA